MSTKKFPKIRKFRPKNVDKYIGDYTKILSRSMWEIKLMKWCDNNPSVLKWNSEDVVIPYWSTADGKMRDYHVDFMVHYKTIAGTVKTILIEVKPYSQTIPPLKGKRKKQETYLNEMYTYQVNQDKWKTAKKWANDNGMDFIVMDEFDLSLKPLKEGKKYR